MRSLTATEQRIATLLADGVPRTKGQIATTISTDGGFTALQQAARETTAALGGLRSRNLVQQLVYETHVGDLHERSERYVLASTVVPVCLPCWRQRWSMDDPPPRVEGWTRTLCVLCGRQTNHGVHVSSKEAQEIQAAS